MPTKIDFIGGNTRRCLMAMALPMIAAMFLNMAYNLVDSLWIGNLLGETAYAALTNSTPIILILTSVAMGATNGVSILLSQAIGAKDKLIITRYILPNAVAPIFISITFRIASAIILESSLSFLGMGVQPPAASWGNMLYNAQSITILTSRPWMWVPPGLALVITILSINFIGNGLRDALDPKTAKK